MISFRVDEIPKGPNGPQGLFRMHWAARHKYFQRWAWLIRVHCLPPDMPIDPATVNVIQHRKRKLDEDNLWASCKPILDGLRANGIIADDSPDHCKLIVWQFTGRDIGTEIQIS